MNDDSSEWEDDRIHKRKSAVRDRRRREGEIGITTKDTDVGKGLGEKKTAARGKDAETKTANKEDNNRQKKSDKLVRPAERKDTSDKTITWKQDGPKEDKDDRKKEQGGERKEGSGKEHQGSPETATHEEGKREEISKGKKENKEEKVGADRKEERKENQTAKENEIREPNDADGKEVVEGRNDGGDRIVIGKEKSITVSMYEGESADEEIIIGNLEAYREAARLAKLVAEAQQALPDSAAAAPLT
jgi:hypothetical protein